MQMKTFRLRLCAVLLCICLILPVCLTAQAEEPLITVSYNLFTDIPANAWYRSSAYAACQNGLLVGIDKTHFAPETEMSRAMLVSVLWRSCGEPEGFENTFSDVPEGCWYEKAVAWAAEKGIVSGTGDGIFSPNDALTREQFAAMLFRFSSFLGKDVSQSDDLSQFPDAEKVSAWARSAVKWAVGAGLISGKQVGEKTYLAPQDATTRAQAAVILKQFYDYPAELPVETLTYGTSGSGSYPLTAYRIGTGENVLLLTYAIHGWEDNFSRDGQELVYLAECVLQTLKENGALLTQGNWTVYILPCLNPDGLYLGTTCNGSGRCTTTRLDEGGNLLTDKGVDMNRSFPYRYKQFSDKRNFNGTAPLQCREAIALADFVKSIQGSGYNLCIDTHGWFRQILAANRGGSIETAFHTQFPSSDTSSGNLANGSGYFSAWAGFELGYDACLFELPSDVYSHTDFIASGYIQRYERAILTILAAYTPGSRVKSASIGELNGN